MRSGPSPGPTAGEIRLATRGPRREARLNRLQVKEGRGTAMRGTEKVKGSFSRERTSGGKPRSRTLLPRPLVPVAQAPLISYTLEWLRDGGVLDATICANSAGRAVREHFGDGRDLGMTLGYYEDWSPRGPAGCARDASLQSQRRHLHHRGRQRHSHRQPRRPARDPRRVPGRGHRSRSSRARAPSVPTWLPAESTSSTAGSSTPFPATGFQDIKETLIPRLYREGERIVTHTAYGACPRVLNARTYLAVNHWMVERLARRPGPLENHEAAGRSPRAHTRRGWTTAPAWSAPSSSGPDVTIRAGATVVGPHDHRRVLHHRRGRARLALGRLEPLRRRRRRGRRSLPPGRRSRGRAQRQRVQRASRPRTSDQPVPAGPRDPRRAARPRPRRTLPAPAGRTARLGLDSLPSDHDDMGIGCHRRVACALPSVLIACTGTASCLSL